MIGHFCLLLPLFSIYIGKATSEFVFFRVIVINFYCIMVSAHCSVVCQNRNGCSANGDCVLGVCQCDTGHTGTHCETSEYYK